MVPGYNKAGGRATKDELAEVIEKLDDAGLKIERANTSGPDYVNAFLGQAGGEQEIENLQVNAELCGEAGLPLFGIQCFPTATLFSFRDELHSWVTAIRTGVPISISAGSVSDGTNATISRA